MLYTTRLWLLILYNFESIHHAFNPKRVVIFRHVFYIYTVPFISSPDASSIQLFIIFWRMTYFHFVLRCIFYRVIRNQNERMNEIMGYYQNFNGKRCTNPCLFFQNQANEESSSNQSDDGAQCNLEESEDNCMNQNQNDNNYRCNHDCNCSCHCDCQNPCERNCLRQCRCCYEQKVHCIDHKYRRKLACLQSQYECCLAQAECAYEQCRACCKCNNSCCCNQNRRRRGGGFFFI